MESSPAGGPRLAPLVFALLLLTLAVGALALAARAETGAPALEGDGVWRARGDWTVQPGDVVVHDGVTIEALGNLTLQGNAVLSLRGGSLTFPNTTAAGRTLTVSAGASLNLTNTTVRLEGAQDRISVLQGALTAEDAVLALTNRTGSEAAIEVVAGSLAFTRCAVRASGGAAVSAQAATLVSTDTDMLRPDGSGADIDLSGSTGSTLLDTTSWGALRTDGRAQVTAIATVRFFLADTAGAPLAGRVNGTGPYGELFALDTSPGAAASARLKWLDYAPAPALVLPADRRAPAPLGFEALVVGIGGNTSQVALTQARQDVTAVVDKTYDVAVVSFTLAGGSYSGPALKTAYYVELNKSVDLLFEVRNKGPAASPSTVLRVVQVALEPSSWAPQGTREVRTVEVRALAPGESVNLSFGFVAGPYGGLLNTSTACLRDVSYTFALDAAAGENLSGDFAPWNNEREFTVVAFETHGEPSPECQPQGGGFLPWAAAAAVGSVAAFGYITYRYSENRAARRAALRAERGEAKAEQPNAPPRP